MATEAVSIQDLEKDILYRAGIERRDSLPITVEAAHAGDLYVVGKQHPTKPFLIVEIFQDENGIRVYALPAPPANGQSTQSEEDKLRFNPTRFTLDKRSKTAVTEVMLLDVFVHTIAGELIDLGAPGDGDGLPKEPQPAVPVPAPAPA